MTKKFVLALLVFTFVFSVNSYAKKVTYSENLKDFIHQKPIDIADFMFFDHQNNSTQLKDFKGNVLLINFWATWCGPCIEEMPSLNKINKQLEKDGVKVIPISVDRANISLVQEFYKHFKLNDLPIYQDKNMHAMKNLKLAALPATIIIGRNGKEVGRVLGVINWDSPETIELLKQL